MADYAVIGKKGTGKSLTSLGIMRDALKEGRRVCTNLNVNLDKLMPSSSRATILRLPDHPTYEDFEAAGRGQDGVDEDENGIIILDECSHFFNARQWNDKGREKTLKWLTESRKMGWSVYYLTQGLKQIDAQVRETQIEYVVHIKRTDKWPIPLITPLSSIFLGEKNAIRFPKMRIATTKQGIERDALTMGYKFYKAEDLFPAYDTQQRFFPIQPQDSWASFGQSPGLHTQLSAWHLKGRYLPRQKTLAELATLALSILVYFAYRITRTALPPAPMPRRGMA